MHQQKVRTARKDDECFYDLVMLGVYRWVNYEDGTVRWFGMDPLNGKNWLFMFSEPAWDLKGKNQLAQ